MFTPSSTEWLNPKAHSLLALLSDQITPELLKVISEADYGYASDKHLAALEGIHDFLEIPAPLEWEPKEVLELIRWSRPSIPGWKPGLPGYEGHLIRAFACAVLVVAAAEEETREYIEEENSTVAALVESLGELGVEFQMAGISEIAWRIQNPPREWEDEPFFLLALLVLTAQVFESKHPSLISELADLCIASENRVRNSEWCIGPEDSSAWLFGLTLFNLNQDIWVSFSSSLRDCAGSIPDDISEKLTLIANLLEGKADAEHAT